MTLYYNNIKEGISDLAKLEMDLMYECNKCGLNLCKGIFRDYRVYSKFESFEFSVEGGYIFQIWHEPKLQYRSGLNKNLFHKQLKGYKPMIIKEAIKYIYTHTMYKFHARERVGYENVTAV